MHARAYFFFGVATSVATKPQYAQTKTPRRGGPRGVGRYKRDSKSRKIYLRLFPLIRTRGDGARIFIQSRS
jgi:hypothetical protein